VLVVLHELMHLVGNLDGSHTYTDVLGNTTSDLASIEDTIILNCIPGARRVDRPSSSGGGVSYTSAIGASIPSRCRMSSVSRLLVDVQPAIAHTRLGR
jgi:hypothetical protein